MTDRYHIDVADLAPIDPDDPAHVESVRRIVDVALQVGGNAGAALCLLITSIEVLARNTDDPAAVLGTASVVVDEMLKDSYPDLASELHRPDGEPS